MPNLPSFNALLFGLGGCLVDFGSRAPALALQRLAHSDTDPGLTHWSEQNASTVEQQAYLQALCEVADELSEATPGALPLLHQLHEQHIACAWLDQQPRDASMRLAQALPHWLPGITWQQHRPWPAPDSIWHSLIQLQVERLDGCVLISGEPKLLQAGLNAGLWTVGLATCGPLCGLALGDWQSLEGARRDQLRSQATLSLYRLGVHSVIDQLTELPACLADLSLRRSKGEKP